MRAQFTPINAETEVQRAAQKPSKGMVHMVKNPVVMGLLAVCAAVLLVLIGVWIARRSPQSAPDGYTKIPNQAAAMAQLTDKQVGDLVKKVNTHIMLPPETPRIVEIANVDQLKLDQPFFRSGANGDQLLVYPSRVILYRPSTDQVVDIAQIRANTAQSPLQSTPSAILQ